MDRERNSIRIDRKGGALLVSCLVAALSGCAVTKPPGPTGCAAYIDAMDAPFAPAVTRGAGPAFGAQVTLETKSRFVQSLDRSLKAMRKRGKRSLNVLILSGGGQWGAFGAGFLNGWSDADRRDASVVERSEIDIVTGISTGALMSSYAFLGTDLDEHLTESYLGTGPEGPDGIRKDPINDEDIFERFGILRTVFSNAATDPRGRLDALVKDAVGGTIDAVAETGDGRQIYVGAVNLEDGGFKVFNLKPLAADAALARDENRPAEREALEACYAEMLLASAAVPYLFPPRFMDGRTYIDGGARFGAFLRFVDAAVAADRGRPLEKKNIFVIVNGDLRVSPVNKVKNNVLGIAERSIEAIVDQIYKDSVFRIEKEADDSSAPGRWKTHYVYVDEPMCRNEHLRKTADKEHDFNPGFMKCIYDLGRTLGERQAWKSFQGIPHKVR
jgi:predicted acylesterase/phospholipase RssA